MTYIYGNKIKQVPKANVVSQYKNKKIIAFSPHADDLSIGAGGFISLLARHNTVIPVLGYTGWRGVAGNKSKEQAIKVREAEMTKEARTLGTCPPVFLRCLTYEEANQKTKDQDTATIKKLFLEQQPDIVIIPSRFDSHPRHRLLTKLILYALRQSKLQVIIFYYETPWSLMDSEDINFLVPVENSLMKKKNKAIKAHESQIQRTNFVRIAQAMSALRAGVMPERLVGGFGSAITLGPWLEAFRYETTPNTQDEN